MFKNVLRLWVIVTLSCFLTAIFFSLFQAFKPNIVFMHATVLLFATLSLLLITAGKKAISTTNHYAFINIVIGYMTGKMFICAIAIFIYAYVQRPQVFFFIIPAALFYFIYTFLEIKALTILQKEK